MQNITVPPGVSCVCATYARPALLEEAIQSFLLQEYAGPKELLVLNDYPEQVLELDHPEVRVVNVGRRFHSLGEKMKAAVALCAHDVLVVWNDDDVSLPHRLSLSMEHFDPAEGFFKATRAFFWNDGMISGLERNVFHGASCWSRELFARVRGYPHASEGVDQALEALFLRERIAAVYATELSPRETYYLYRWGGTGSYHLSALTYAGVGEWVAQQGEIPTGRIELRPRWRQDYAALAGCYLDWHHP